MKDKVVIITGGSSGIGKALSFEFGRHGAKILITGRNKETLDQVASELQESGIEVMAFQADVCRKEDNQKMVEAVIDQWGKIDILINNAGISMRALFEDVDLDVIKRVMDINFYGALFASKYCLPHIIKTKGSIVGVSSIAGYRGLPGRVGYSASKFALQGFLEALRSELIPKNIHVLTACPGFTASNIRRSALTKDGSSQGTSPRDESKEMTAEECASRIFKATKKRKKHLVLTTQGIFVVWMNKFVPGFMDKIVFNALAKEPDSPFKNK